MSVEMEEGFRLEMAEYIRQENELKAKLAILADKMQKPEEKLAKAKEIVLKAKAAYDAILAELTPLRSDKTLSIADEFAPLEHHRLHHLQQLRRQPRQRRRDVPERDLVKHPVLRARRGPQVG